MPCRVLVADDHQIVRQRLRGLQEAAGHEVIGEASDGREALEFARTLNPDFAVLDLSMPLPNGLGTAREMRRHAPDIRIILLTMYTEKRYVLQALRAGARGYVLNTQAPGI